MTRLHLKRLEDGFWWIIGLTPPHGPYLNTKEDREEAKSDLEGLKRFYERLEGKRTLFAEDEE